MVTGEFPLQVGDTVTIFSRNFVYAGTDCVGGDEGQEPPDVPTLSISASSVDKVEGDDGVTEYAFKITRAGDELGGASTANVAFVPGDTDADDFGGALPETQTLTFAPGETEKLVIFAVSGDTAAEPDESFQVSLEFASGAIIDDAAGSATGVITNDDEEAVLPTVGIRPNRGHGSD